MASRQLPWWLDYDNVPPEDASAQVIWISGRWRYIPFAFGRPLARKCGTLDEAHEAVFHFETDIHAKVDEIADLRAGGQDSQADEKQAALEIYQSENLAVEVAIDPTDVPYDVEIYSLRAGAPNEPCIVVDVSKPGEGRILFRDAAANYSSAFEQIARGSPRMHSR